MARGPGGAGVDGIGDDGDEEAGDAQQWSWLRE